MVRGENLGFWACKNAIFDIGDEEKVLIFPSTNVSRLYMQYTVLCNLVFTTKFAYLTQGMA